MDRRAAGCKRLVHTGASRPRLDFTTMRWPFGSLPESTPGWQGPPCFTVSTDRKLGSVIEAQLFGELRVYETKDALIAAATHGKLWHHPRFALHPELFD